MNRPARPGPRGPLALQDAKARFSEVVDAAVRGRAQHVTRRGRPAVVVVSTAEYESLLRRSRSDAGGFVEHLLARPKAAASSSRFRSTRPARGGLRPRDVDFPA